MSGQVEFLIDIAKDYNINLVNYKSYSVEQVIEIFRGLKDGLDVSLYDSKNISANQMNVIRRCMLEGIPKPVIEAGYSTEQLERIIEIYNMGINLKFLEPPKPDMRKHFDRLVQDKRFANILLWDKSNSDIIMQCFADGFTLTQMRIIAKAINKNLDIKPLLNKDFSEEQLEQLVLILKEGLDPKPVLDASVSWMDMAIYRLRN